MIVFIKYYLNSVLLHFEWGRNTNMVSMKIQAHENKNNPLEMFQPNVYLLVKKISVTVNKDFVHVLNPDMPVVGTYMNFKSGSRNTYVMFLFFCLLALIFTHLINAEIWPKIRLPKMSLLCNSWHTLCGIFFCQTLATVYNYRRFPDYLHKYITYCLGWGTKPFSCLFCPDFCFFNAHFTKSRIRLRFLTSLCWLRNPSLFKMWNGNSFS